MKHKGNAASGSRPARLAAVSTELGMGPPVTDVMTGLWQNVPQAI